MKLENKILYCTLLPLIALCLIILVGEAKAYVPTTDEYNEINIPGLEAAHLDDQTGEGIDILIHDNSFVRGQHGYDVSEIAEYVAPEANIIQLDTAFDYYDQNTINAFMRFNLDILNADQYDVINHSYGYQLNGIQHGTEFRICYPTRCFSADVFPYNFNQYQASTVADYNAKIAAATNAVHVHAAGNGGQVTGLSGVIRNPLYRTTYRSALTQTDINGNPSGPSIPWSWSHRAIISIDNTGCLIQGNRYTTDSCTSHKWMLDAGSDYSRTILVGATEDDVSLAPYSNSAGTRAMNHYIVADGSNPNGGRGGTSFAAPRVTGAIALIMDKFGSNAVDAKAAILNSADDLGAPGVDPVFGHGLLNIGAALSPMGSLE